MSKLLLTGDGAAAGPEPLSVSRSVQFTKPHRINAWRGATTEDLIQTAVDIHTCRQLFLSAVQGHLEVLEENLSSSLDTKKLISQLENALHDPMADILGALDKASAS